jgi:hypothetical protein
MVGRLAITTGEGRFDALVHNRVRFAGAATKSHRIGDFWTPRTRMGIILLGRGGDPFVSRCRLRQSVRAAPTPTDPEFPCDFGLLSP